MVAQISKKAFFQRQNLQDRITRFKKIITAFRIVVNSVGIKRKSTMRSIYFNSFDKRKLLQSDFTTTSPNFITDSNGYWAMLKDGNTQGIDVS